MALLVLVGASSAFAQNEALWKLVGLVGISLVEISCNVSTAASASSSSGSSARASAECDSNSDCHSSYQCFAGSCVAPIQPNERTGEPEIKTVSSSGEAADIGARCGIDADCPTGMGCSYSTCACANGQCLSAPPIPSSSLQRRGSELYLRARVVELREELALGRGPVINGLAFAEGVPARQLGRALREHRAELIALIGDGSDGEWSAKFLARVDQLCSHS